MYDDVLVPTDGSPDAESAVAHALDVAADNDATVHAVFVVNGHPRADEWADVAGVGADSDGRRPRQATLRDRGEEAVQSVADRADQRGLECVTAVLEGRPHERILEYADLNDVDLIVMGTRGRSGLRRFLLGSVTETVVRASPVPVLCLSHEDSVAVTDPETAIRAARRALERQGYETVTVEEAPYRQRSSWVVRAEADEATFNVHVSATGETSVARIGDTSA